MYNRPLHPIDISVKITKIAGRDEYYEFKFNTMPYANYRSVCMSNIKSFMVDLCKTNSYSGVFDYGYMKSKYASDSIARQNGTEEKFYLWFCVLYDLVAPLTPDQICTRYIPTFKGLWFAYLGGVNNETT